MGKQHSNRGKRSGSVVPGQETTGAQPKILYPYRDSLSFPPVYNLTGGLDEESRAVKIQTAEHSYAPSQLPKTCAWTYDGTVPGARAKG